MPRPNKGRAIRAEANLAQRIAYERKQRGWTLDGLASRMSSAGCPINASAIYKIESADPPRRVTVDELVALRIAFGFDTTEELLLPLALVRSHRAQEVFGEVVAAWDDSAEAVGRLTNALTEYFDLVVEEPEIRSLVDDLWFGDAGGDGDAAHPIGQVIDGKGNVLVADLPELRAALNGLLRAAIETASVAAIAGLEANRSG